MEFAPDRSIAVMPPAEDAGDAPEQSQVKNRILRSIPPEDYEAIRPFLRGETLRTKQILNAPGEAPVFAYFLEGGIISYTLPMPRGGAVEFGVTGREGLSSFSVFREGRSSPVAVTVQIGGAKAYRIAGSELRRFVEERPALRAECFDYLYYFMGQMAYSAVSNTRHTLSARLARWLLLCHDRLDGNEVPLTHEFMAMMLGAQRTSVTATLHALEAEDAIRSRRGVVEIIDRARLRECAGEAYLDPPRSDENGLYSLG